MGCAPDNPVAYCSCYLFFGNRLQSRVSLDWQQRCKNLADKNNCFHVWNFNALPKVLKLY